MLDDPIRAGQSGSPTGEAIQTPVADHGRSLRRRTALDIHGRSEPQSRSRTSRRRALGAKRHRRRRWSRCWLLGARRLVRPLLVDRRPLHGVDRRRLCRRPQRDARPPRSPATSPTSPSRTTPTSRPATSSPASTTATIGWPSQTARDKIAVAAGDHRADRQADRRRSRRPSSRRRRSSPPPRPAPTRADLELKRQQELADAPDQQPAGAGAGAGQPRPGRRRRAGRRGGDRSRRRPMSTC